MMRITNWIMKFTPVGAFALVCPVMIEIGWSAIQPLLLFAGTDMVALGIHALVTMSLLLKFLGKVNPVTHLKAMFPALLTAFSTSSSSATLPVTVECLEDRAGVSKRTTGFVVQMGATINMDGTALYECVCVMFIAQAMGISLDITTQVLVVLLALLTSIGVAGVPSTSLVAIVIILDAVGLPPEGIGLFLAVDRPLDMLRTVVNVYSDSCGAAIIDKVESGKIDGKISSA